MNIPSEYKDEESAVSDDPIDNIISIFSNHPSIMSINDNVVKGNFSFHTVSISDIEKEIRALDSKKASMSSSIPPNLFR